MNSIVKEILREYEAERLVANNILKERQNIIYKEIPRILEIDNILNNTGFSIVKKILNNNTGNTTELINRMEYNNNKLIAERKTLLLKNGFKADYLTDIYKCSKCKDTGFIGNEKCPCFKQKLVDKFYDYSNLKKILAVENFDTFDLRYYSDKIDVTRKKSPLTNIRLIYKSCMDFVKNFETNFNNILFQGESGLGKTFLCNCIAKDILDKGHTVLYVTAPQMFKFIEDYRFNRDDFKNGSEYINMIYSVDLLIIDDLGTEIVTTVTSSELFNIINTRILEKKPIIISTNIQIEDFEERYSDRLTSRFYGYYTIMRFFGEDIRLLKKYENNIKV